MKEARAQLENCLVAWQGIDRATMGKTKGWGLTKAPPASLKSVGHFSLLD